MEDVVEYNFSTQPEWISEAIEFTDTGIELNFKKLSAICGQSSLPSRLCIILEGSHSINNGLCNTEQKPHGDRVKGQSSDIHRSSTNAADRRNCTKKSVVGKNGNINTIARMNGSDVNCQRNLSHLEVDSGSLHEVVKNNQNFLTVPTEKNGPKPVRRSESVLAREIRLQRERESEVKIERLRALRQLRRNRLRKERNFCDGDESSSISNLSSDDGHQPAGVVTQPPAVVVTQPPARVVTQSPAGVVTQPSTGVLTQPPVGIVPSPSGQTDVSDTSLELHPSKDMHSMTQPPISTEFSATLDSPSERGSKIISDAEKGLSQSTPASNGGSRMLTSVQKRIVSEKAKKIGSGSESTADPQTKPRSRREILRSRIHPGAVSKVDADNVTNRQHTDTSSGSQSSNRGVGDGSAPAYVDRSMQRIEQEIKSLRQREEELRYSGVKV